MRPVFLILLAVSSPAFGHKIEIKLTFVAPNVRVEAYYEDETPAQQAKVTIYDGDVVIASGRTDDTGVWTFPIPSPGTYSVRVEDLGHAARETLLVPHVLASTPPTDTPRQTGTRWGKLAIGLGIIAFVSLFPLLWRKTRSRNVTH